MNWNLQTYLLIASLRTTFKLWIYLFNFEPNSLSTLWIYLFLLTLTAKATLFKNCMILINRFYSWLWIVHRKRSSTIETRNKYVSIVLCLPFWIVHYEWEIMNGNFQSSDLTRFIPINLKSMALLPHFVARYVSIFF